MSRKYELEDSKPRPVAAIPRDVPRCQHIKVNGTQCGSPALRGRRLCYYHDRLRRNFPHLPQGHGIVTAADLPFPDDPDAIQVILMRVIVALLEHRMDRRDAGLILYALQTATINLRTRQRPAWHEMVLATNPPETLEPEKIPHEGQEEESLAALLMRQLQLETEEQHQADTTNQQQAQPAAEAGSNANLVSETIPAIHACVTSNSEPLPTSPQPASMRSRINPRGSTTSTHQMVVQQHLCRRGDRACSGRWHVIEKIRDPNRIFWQDTLYPTAPSRPFGDHA